VRLVALGVKLFLKTVFNMNILATVCVQGDKGHVARGRLHRIFTVFIPIPKMDFINV